MSEPPQRPTTSDRDAWRVYWAHLGQPWRTEPEIGNDRRRFLDQCRRIPADWKQGVYGFRHVRLARDDIEWLLETHAAGQWIKRGKSASEAGYETLTIRGGLDLRGADLRGVDLHRLPLSQLRGGLQGDAWDRSTALQREAAAIHLEGADLHQADLQEAALRGAHLEGANLERAHLEGATLRAAYLGSQVTSPALRRWHWHAPTAHISSPPADLQYAFFSHATTLDGIVLGNRITGFARLADVRWAGVDVATVQWDAVTMLGDEYTVRRRMPEESPATRRNKIETAVRANRQLATVLRSQGLTEQADRFAYRAQKLQRLLLRHQGIQRWPAYVGSLLLDVLAGYGYRPIRSFLAYLIAVIWFANLYHLLGLPPLDSVVFSMASFHGRGFFPTETFTLHSPLAIMAALEAFFGLLIEITFIATFTRRFFAR